jgi:flagellar hook-associated protein 3 FlgL
MIRVSTAEFYRTSTQAMMQRQRDLMDTQAQISSGKRINSPSDDPVGAAQAAGTRTALSQFDQFKSNQDRATYLLNLGESTLGQFVNSAQSVKEQLIAAGDGAYSNAERSALATNLQGILSQMVGLANSSDGAGGYLFAGSKEASPPFSQAGNTVSYNGDNTPLQLEVSTNRFQQVKQSGDDVLLKVRAGNGTFTTSAASTNTGAASIDPGSVVDPTKVTGSSYSIGFSVSGGVATYQVVRASDSAVVASGTYTSPSAITFDGQQVTITGAPANGDSFAVAPSGYQSIFDTVASAVALLQKGVTTSADMAQLQTSLSGLGASLDQGLNQLSLKRAQYGSALSELDTDGQINDDQQLQYKTRLSSLEDLDLGQATVDLSQRQSTYQAAIQSYSVISKLSLFNYLT